MRPPGPMRGMYPLSFPAGWTMTTISGTGQARFNANHPLLRNITRRALRSRVCAGTPKRCAWSDVALGRCIGLSTGTLDWGKDPAVWSARVSADHVPLDEWQPLLISGDERRTPRPFKRNVQRHGNRSRSARRSLFSFGRGPLARLSIYGGRRRSVESGGHQASDAQRPALKSGGDFLFSGLLTLR